jgi:hypothetical protein
MSRGEGESWGRGSWGRGQGGVKDAKVQHEELDVGLESQISPGGCAQAVDEVHDQPQEEMEYQTIS